MPFYRKTGYHYYHAMLHPAAAGKERD
jgi:hypothetical protein